MHIFKIKHNTIKTTIIFFLSLIFQDTQFIINQLGLEDRLHVEWIHKTSDTRTSDIATAYFSQLTLAQVSCIAMFIRWDCGGGELCGLNFFLDFCFSFVG